MLAMDFPALSKSQYFIIRKTCIQGHYFWGRTWFPLQKMVWLCFKLCKFGLVGGFSHLTVFPTEDLLAIFIMLLFEKRVCC